MNQEAGVAFEAGAAVTREQLAVIETPEQLGDALRVTRERAGITGREMVRMAAVHRPRVRPPGSLTAAELTRDKISAMEKGSRILVDEKDGTRDDRLEFYLYLCGLTHDERIPWLEAAWRVHNTEPSARTVHEPSEEQAPDQPPPSQGPRAVSPWLATAIITVVVVIGAAAVVTVTAFGHDNSPDRPDLPIVVAAGETTTAVPDATAADPASAPLQVVDVTRMVNEDGDFHFVTKDKIDLDSAALETLNTTVVPNTQKFAAWYTTNNAVPLKKGIATVTLRANTTESVRITRMSAIKDCTAPYTGTMFHQYTQGGPTENIKVGFNLDNPDPVAQEMIWSANSGYRLAGPNYFAANTLTFDPGQTHTVTLGAMTELYSCAFRLRVFVATSHGTVYQDIGAGDKPFLVSAQAPTPDPAYRFAAYQALYVRGTDKSWARADPRTTP